MARNGRLLYENCPICSVGVSRYNKQKRSRHVAACRKKIELLGQQKTETKEQERQGGLVVLDSKNSPLPECGWGGKIAHFLFFDVGAGDLDSCSNADLYKSNLSAFCALHPDWLVLLWQEEGVTQLINTRAKQLTDMYGVLTGVGNVFYMVDFSRYVILSIYGGVYVDLDIKLTQQLAPDTQYVFSSKKDGQQHGRITNSLLCLTDKDLYSSLIQFVIARFFTCAIPKDWDRHLLYSVGALGFAAFCRQMNIEPTITEDCDWIVDSGTVAWVGLNKKRKKAEDRKQEAESKEKKSKKQKAESSSISRRSRQKPAGRRQKAGGKR